MINITCLAFNKEGVFKFKCFLDVQEKKNVFSDMDSFYVPVEYIPEYDDNKKYKYENGKVLDATDEINNFLLEKAKKDRVAKLNDFYSSKQVKTFKCSLGEIEFDIKNVFSTRGLLKEQLDQLELLNIDSWGYVTDNGQTISIDKETTKAYWATLVDIVNQLTKTKGAVALKITESTSVEEVLAVDIESDLILKKEELISNNPILIG